MYALSIQMQPDIKKNYDSNGGSRIDSELGVMSEEDDGSDTESEEQQENDDDEENMGCGNRHLGFIIPRKTIFQFFENSSVIEVRTPGKKTMEVIRKKMTTHKVPIQK